MMIDDVGLFRYKATYVCLTIMFSRTKSHYVVHANALVSLVLARPNVALVIAIGPFDPPVMKNSHEKMAQLRELTLN